jgi:WhiB family redox-sensing transcriptional regulator
VTIYPCRQQPEAFHAPDGERADSIDYVRRVNEARALCARCPIMLACREQGRQMREPGIWGGETDEERAAAGYPPPNLAKRLPAACGTPSGARRHRRIHHEPPCDRCLAGERAAANSRRIRAADARAKRSPVPA